jgi:hypothetical protein
VIALPVRRFKLRHVCQITDAHCGPAVVQMMLSHLGIDVRQEDVAEAAGVTDFIHMHGTRVVELAQAVERLAPSARFYWKDHASLDDIDEVVSGHGYPVGVEWQGVFDDADPEKNDPDYGHYSVVAHVDRAAGRLVIVDPYKDYFERERELPCDLFERRWWDHNEVRDPGTGETRLVRDERLMFVVVPSDNAEVARAVGMRGPDALLESA